MIVRRLATIGLVVISAACSSGEAVSRLEITQTDPVTFAGFSAAGMSVFGVWIGQPRSDAIAAVRKHGGTLVSFRSGSTPAQGDEKVCATTICQLHMGPDDYGGAAVEFDAQNQVSGISIDWDVEFSEPNDPGARVKGPLGQILRKYSDQLRLQTLGNADREERIPGNGGDFVTYFYDGRGLSVWVQRQAAEKAADRGRASVVLSLFKPQSRK